MWTQPWLLAHGLEKELARTNEDTVLAYLLQSNPPPAAETLGVAVSSAS